MTSQTLKRKKKIITGLELALWKNHEIAGLPDDILNLKMKTIIEKAPMPEDEEQREAWLKLKKRFEDYYYWFDPSTLNYVVYEHT